MRAVVCEHPGDESVLRIGEVARPQLGATDIRIAVRSTAVNRADLLQRQGLYPPPPGASEILGLEAAGDVVEVGKDVSDWQTGDRVMALLPGGGYAEEVVVDGTNVLRVPECFSDEEAGATPEVFITAFLNIFVLGAPPERACVLIHGGGSGVGTAAISLCKATGFSVFVTAGSEEKCRQCLGHGADVAINYREESFRDRIKAVTNGEGVDVVLDCVGGRYLESNLRCLAVGGTLVIIGLMGGSRAEVDLGALLVKRLRIVGSTLRSRSTAEKAETIQAFLARFGDALDEGRLRPVICRGFALEEVAAAHRLVKSGKHFGKVTMRVASS
jgi:putative PIG3 family NAD(P)H quinone oxidoreductase